MFSPRKKTFINEHLLKKDKRVGGMQMPRMGKLKTQPTGQRKSKNEMVWTSN